MKITLANIRTRDRVANSVTCESNKIGETEYDNGMVGFFINILYNYCNNSFSECLKTIDMLISKNADIDLEELDVHQDDWVL